MSRLGNGGNLDHEVDNGVVDNLPDAVASLDFPDVASWGFAGVAFDCPAGSIGLVEDSID